MLNVYVGPSRESYERKAARWLGDAAGNMHQPQFGMFGIYNLDVIFILELSHTFSMIGTADGES